MVSGAIELVGNKVFDIIDSAKCILCKYFNANAIRIEHFENFLIAHIAVRQDFRRNINVVYLNLSAREVNIDKHGF